MVGHVMPSLFIEQLGLSVPGLFLLDAHCSHFAEEGSEEGSLSRRRVDGAGGGGGAVIVMVRTTLQPIDQPWGPDHSPASRSDCPVEMVTSCVEVVIWVMFGALDTDSESGCMVPSLGPTVQPFELQPYSTSPRPISTR